MARKKKGGTAGASSSSSSLPPPVTITTTNPTQGNAAAAAAAAAAEGNNNNKLPLHYGTLVSLLQVGLGGWIGFMGACKPGTSHHSIIIKKYMYDIYMLHTNTRTPITDPQIKPIYPHHYQINKTKNENKKQHRRMPWKCGSGSPRAPRLPAAAPTA
jgi:hypothetical protein